MNHISLFSELLAFGRAQQPPIVEPIPDVELAEEWNNFEKTLDTYKIEYIKSRHSLYQKESAYSTFVGDLEVLRDTLKHVNDSTLRENIEKCIGEFIDRTKIQEKKEELALLSGKVKAMERVLLNTNAKRHAQFTCPICMDRPVSIFINPCGHLICEVCMLRLQDAKCPTCRTENTTKCKMYTSL